MNHSILKDNVQEWINEHLNQDVTRIALNKSPFDTVTSKELAQQIESKQKSEKKLPTWFNTKGIYYPPKLSIEQTSSEKLASYKASLVKGDVIADLTGGFGVDSYYFSKQFKKVYHCEINQELSEIAQLNATVLGCKNIYFRNQDGINFLEEVEEKIDCIFLDPARRHEKKGKVISLENYEPNVLKHLDLLIEKGKKVMIKTSPMLDLTLGINQLKYVKEVHAVSLKNELKELLWVLSKNREEQDIQVNAIQLFEDEYKGMSFSLNQQEEVIYAEELGNYLYEPNASIMKVQGYQYIGAPFFKLSPNSHLFTSREPFDFPGRCFQIKEHFLFSKNEMSKKLKGKKMNVSTRNFPLSPEQIKKKFNLTDGGEDYVFFTTLKNQKIVIVTEKIV